MMQKLFKTLQDKEISEDELVTLYLLIRRISDMGRQNKYRDHPFRERLRSLMFSAKEIQGLTCTQIADDLGISVNAIACYRAGTYLPGAELLLKLADYFGVSTDYLLGREGYEIEVE